MADIICWRVDDDGNDVADWFISHGCKVTDDPRDPDRIRVKLAGSSIENRGASMKSMGLDDIVKRGDVTDEVLAQYDSLEKEIYIYVIEPK